MADPITEAILEEASVAQMLELYNQVPGVRMVSRLSDRTTAQARVRLALGRAGLKLARVRGASDQYRVVPLDAASAAGGRGTLLRRIVVLAEHCPKRAGTASAARWALYRSGMTVGEYVDLAVATGVSRWKAHMDVYTDRDHEYIRLEE